MPDIRRMIEGRRILLFFGMFLPASLLITWVAAWQWSEQRHVILAHYRTEAQHHVEGQMRRIDRFYRHADVMLLALAKSGKALAAIAGDPVAAREIQRLFMDVARSSILYDQIRLLDWHGREVVRMERLAGHLRFVPPEALQAKTSRYYVQQALKLPGGEVYISPFDLNVEHGEVQRPFRATVRFATSLMNEQGILRGLLVLNLSGMSLMSRELSETRLEGEHLLFNAGSPYWFDRLDGGLRVGSGDMLPRRFPAEWRRINRRPTGQFVTGAGLFSHEIETPGADLKLAVNSARRWTIVSFVPEAALAGKLSKSRAMILPIALAMILLTGIASWALAGWATSRREFLRKLQSSEEQFRHLVESNLDPMIIHRQGRIVYANPAAVNLIGAHTIDEILGREVLEYLHQDDRSPAMDRMEQVDQEGVRSPLAESRFHRQDGSWITIEVTSCPFEFEGRPSILTIGHDITARKQAEEEREHLLAENQRLSQGLLKAAEDERLRISRTLHDDIGQKLTAIQMKAATIASQCGRKDCVVAEDGMQRIQEITTGLIDIVCHEIKSIRPPQLDELGLTGALGALCAEWRENTGIRCNLRANDSTDSVDREVQLHLYRIVQEALTNVARHARASRVDVHLRINDTARLSIRDDGRGFDPQAPAEGIGLAGMRERAQALGGDLRIESSPNEGTRLVIHIPRAPLSKSPSETI